MILECKAPVNIIHADMRDMDGKAFGQMVVQLPEDQEICARMLGFMEARGLAMWEIPPGSCIDCDPEDYDYEQERGAPCLIFSPDSATRIPFRCWPKGRWIPCT